MLKVEYSRFFLRQYKKLTIAEKKKVKNAIKTFEKNPRGESLKTHKLSGPLKDFYSFSADYNLRIVFEITKQKTALLLKVGGHEIYR